MELPTISRKLDLEGALDLSALQDTAPTNNIGIATSTMYPEWYPGQAQGDPSTAKLRGDLALRALTAASDRGYPVEVVDGGSPNAFLDACGEAGANVRQQREPGMSAGRRQAFEAIAEHDGVEVLCWVEPEKVSIIRDCVEIAAEPILDGNADIVVPSRDTQSFSTYPDYQADFEMRSNVAWNNILRNHGLLSTDAPDLDAWIGPRLFRNSPEILQLFLNKYRFAENASTGFDQNAPELWPNALFLPLVRALKDGHVVEGVPVPYVHPPEQTAHETDSEEFRKKRAFQMASILEATERFARYLEGDPDAGIERF